jgi:hypothetical protein
MGGQNRQCPSAGLPVRTVSDCKVPAVCQGGRKESCVRSGKPQFIVRRSNEKSVAARCGLWPVERMRWRLTRNARRREPGGRANEAKFPGQRQQRPSSSISLNIGNILWRTIREPYLPNDLQGAYDRGCASLWGNSDGGTREPSCSVADSDRREHSAGSCIDPGSRLSNNSGRSIKQRPVH